MFKYDSASAGPNVVRVYQGLTSNQYVGTPANTSYFGYQNDFLFLGGITSQPGVISDWMRCSEIGGYANFSTEKREQIVTRPFDVTNVDHKWQEDKRRYGYGFFYPELGAYPGIHEREHTVYHPTYTGQLTDDLDDSAYHYIPGGDAMGWLYWSFRKFRRHTYSLAPWGYQVATGVSEDGFLTFTQTSVSDPSIPHLGMDAFSWINELCELIGDSEVSYAPNLNWMFLWRNVKNTSFRGDNSYHFRIAYDYEMRGGDVGWPPNYGIYKVNISFDVRFRPVYGSNSVYDTHPIHPQVVDLIDNSSVQLVENASWMVSNPPLVVTPISISAIGNPGFLTSVVGSASGRHVRDNNFHNYCRGGLSKNHRASIDIPVGRRLTTHRDFFTDVLPDLRASSFFSSCDAISKASGSLQANHLENLFQIEGLKDILPSLLPLYELVIKLAKGDSSALKELIDYITDAILKYRFAQKPLIKDADELARSDIRTVVERKFAKQAFTAYGSYEYIFPHADNPYKDGKLVLVTRSKIRVHANFGTTVGAIMAADGLGVLPSLSRLWALLPFSFVVDWIFNMEGRLDAIDRAFLMKCYAVQWAVHSYTLTYYPSDSLLRTYGLRNSGSDDPFGLRMYAREFTAYAPYLRQSRFDFLDNPTVPRLETVGSLIWQVLT